MTDEKLGDLNYLSQKLKQMQEVINKAEDEGYSSISVSVSKDGAVIANVDFPARTPYSMAEKLLVAIENLHYDLREEYQNS